MEKEYLNEIIDTLKKRVDELRLQEATIETTVKGLEDQRANLLDEATTIKTEIKQTRTVLDLLRSIKDGKNIVLAET